MVAEGLSVNELVRWKNSDEKFSKDIATIFPAQLEFISPTVYDGCVADDLSILPLSASQKEKLKTKFGSIELALNHGTEKNGWNKGEYFKVLRSVFPMAEIQEVKREHEKICEHNQRKAQLKEVENGTTVSMKLRLLLSAGQMIEESYPIPMKGHMSEKYSDYVMTSNEDGYLPLTKDSPLYSVDCEMCLTSIGRNELTRVCVVDSDLKVVYHRYAKS